MTFSEAREILEYFELNDICDEDDEAQLEEAQKVFRDFGGFVVE
jgi:hypothetical protein